MLIIIYLFLRAEAQNELSQSAVLISGIDGTGIEIGNIYNYIYNYR